MHNILLFALEESLPQLRRCWGVYHQAILPLVVVSPIWAGECIRPLLGSILSHQVRFGKSKLELRRLFSYLVICQVNGLLRGTERWRFTDPPHHERGRVLVHSKALDRRYESWETSGGVIERSRYRQANCWCIGDRINSNGAATWWVTWIWCGIPRVRRQVHALAKNLCTFIKVMTFCLSTFVLRKSWVGDDVCSQRGQKATKYLKKRY